jgi:hypothetical protein
MKKRRGERDYAHELLEKWRITAEYPQYFVGKG